MSLGKLNRSSSVSNIGGCNVNCVRQTIGINGNMPFNARDFLASVIAFFTGCVSVLDTLGVNDAKARAQRATMAGADLAN